MSLPHADLRIRVIADHDERSLEWTRQECGARVSVMVLQAERLRPVRLNLLCESHLSNVGPRPAGSPQKLVEGLVGQAGGIEASRRRPSHSLLLADADDPVRCADRGRAIPVRAANADKDLAHDQVPD
jgi:hypothetical protein